MSPPLTKISCNMQGVTSYFSTTVLGRRTVVPWYRGSSDCCVLTSFGFRAEIRTRKDARRFRPGRCPSSAVLHYNEERNHTTYNHNCSKSTIVRFISHVLFSIVATISRIPSGRLVVMVSRSSWIFSMTRNDVVVTTIAARQLCYSLV